MTASTAGFATLAVALREAALKIAGAARELGPGDHRENPWVQRVISREIQNRARTRGPAHWEALFPGLSPEQRAQRRIRRMLTRATVAGVAAAAGASAAELLPLLTEGVTLPLALPLGAASVAAEMFYTTALQIDLAFDLASIYGVPFAADDTGEIATLLAAAVGVELQQEPTRHDKPARPEQTKRWRVVRQMRRDDFARQVGVTLLEQSIVRNTVPVVGVVVSAAWNQIVLRRYARQVDAAMRHRFNIVNACRGIDLGDDRTARVILDGAWLLATADGAVNHQEALALSMLIDSLSLPERISVREASFSDDEEAWFERLPAFAPAAHDALVRVLTLVAGADGDLTTPERRFFRRLARTLAREIDLHAIEALIGQVRAGDSAGVAKLGLVAG